MRFPSLVIFDMDGLMFDTEELAGIAWEKAGKHFGFEIDRSITAQFVGMKNESIIKSMIDIYGEEAPVLEWRKFMKARKHELEDELMYKESFKKKGLISLLDYLKSEKILIAVASSSEKNIIDKFLKVSDTSKYIDYIVSGDEVVNGKPDPEVFLTACKKADVSPDEAIVLEDSPAGINAAKSAEIPCFWVPDTVKETKELSELATKVFSDLGEVELYLRSLS